MVPLLDSKNMSYWIVKNFKDILKRVLETFVKKLDEAKMQNMIYVLWGINK